jgi:benzoate-CoA ligase family protein
MARKPGSSALQARLGKLHNAAVWLVDRHLEDGNGGRVAYRCRGCDTTYGELAREIWRVQNALAQMGVRRGERVAMVVDDELAWPAWFLGCLRSGVVAVPLSTMLTGDDLSLIVTDAEASVLVISARYIKRLQSIVAGSADLRDVVVVGGEADDRTFHLEGIAIHPWSGFDDASQAPVAPTREDSPGFWLYSSGTTGVPKGVMHRHASLAATALTYAKEVLGIAPEDKCYSVAKLFFAFGLGNSLTFPLSVGASAVLNPDPPNPANVVEIVSKERPSLFFASPGFLASLLDAQINPSAFSSVRATVTAGEALPAEIQRRFSSSFGHQVLDGLGTTEALHIFLSNRFDSVRPGTSGIPVPGYEVRLVDEHERQIDDPDTPGYLEVKGPSLATGYWCKDSASRAAFRGQWLATGDVYAFSSDGYWRFLGRNNDMVKAGGIWVSPAEVESVLLEHPDILEAAVVGDRDQAGLETTIAFCVPRAGASIDPEEIIAHCRSRMAAFKRPRRVIVVDSLPKTATGKIKRFELRDRLAHEREVNANGWRGEAGDREFSGDTEDIAANR